MESKKKTVVAFPDHWRSGAVVPHPLLLVWGLFADRETHQAKAGDRIAQSMVGPQQVVGPLRVVPWQEQRSTTVVGEDGRPTARQNTVQGYALQTPLSLSAISKEDAVEQNSSRY